MPVQSASPKRLHALLHFSRLDGCLFLASELPHYSTVLGATTTRAVGRILPSSVVAVEAIGPVEPDVLFADELTHIVGAGDRRRAEFSRARSCAHRALASLGEQPVAIRRGPQREPMWPAGTVGSITHCAEYCCAAVARNDRWAAIGIDAEVLKELEAGVQENIMTAAERRHLQAFDASIAWSCVVFSAKEAVFKAWYPRTRRWLNFHDVQLRFDTVHARFEAELLISYPILNDRPLPFVSGRYCIDGRRVITAVCIEA